MYMSTDPNKYTFIDVPACITKIQTEKKKYYCNIAMHKFQFLFALNNYKQTLLEYYTITGKFAIIKCTLQMKL